MKLIHGLVGLGAVASVSGCATFTGGSLYEEGQPSGYLIVQNGSGVAIDTLTLSRCNAMSHGLDRLSGDAIPHMGGRRFRLSTGCWDLMVGRSGACRPTGNGGQTCSWRQSPSRRFNITAGGTERITFGS
jgi:hypothetical protein